MKKHLNSRALCLILALVLVTAYTLVPVSAYADDDYYYSTDTPEPTDTSQPTDSPDPEPTDSPDPEPTDSPAPDPEPTDSPDPDPDGSEEDESDVQPMGEELPPVYLVTERLEDDSLRSDVVVSLPTIIEEGAMVSRFSPHVINLVHALVDFSFEQRHEVNGICVRWSEEVAAPEPRTCRLVIDSADLDELLERLPELDMSLNAGFATLYLSSDALHELSELGGGDLVITLTDGDPVAVEYLLDGAAVQAAGELS